MDCSVLVDSVEVYVLQSTKWTRLQHRAMEYTPFTELALLRALHISWVLFCVIKLPEIVVIVDRDVLKPHEVMVYDPSHVDLDKSPSFGPDCGPIIDMQSGPVVKLNASKLRNSSTGMSK
eukprot:513242_1